MGAKVSSVTVTITETDIMSNIREFVNVEGLTFNNVEFKDKSIEVTGNFHKVIDIPFLLRVKVVDVHNNKIRIIIEKIKALKIGVPNVALMGAATALKSKLEPFGVTVNGNEVIIDADKILTKVDHVHMMIDNILMENGVLAVKVSAISADVKAMTEEKKAKEEYETSGQEEMDKKLEVERIKAQATNYNEKLNSIIKENDEYTSFRQDMKNKVPDDYEYLFEYVAAIPDIFALAYRVMKDKRVMMKDKVIIGLTGGYFLSPIDIFPDSIPFIGKFDDLALFTFGLNHMLNKLPYPIIVEHWAGDLGTLKLIVQNLDKLMAMVGANKINKVYNLIEKPLNNKFGLYKDDEYYFTSKNIATMNPYIINEEEDLIVTKEF